MVIRILYADDEKINRTTFQLMLNPKRILDKYDLEVDVDVVDCRGALVDSGRNALEEGSPYDVIVTDNDMPSSNEGVMGIKELRQMGRYSETPIFLYSGGLHSELEKKALIEACGATDYIEKGGRSLNVHIPRILGIISS